MRARSSPRSWAPMPTGPDGPGESRASGHGATGSSYASSGQPRTCPPCSPLGTSAPSRRALRSPQRGSTRCHPQAPTTSRRTFRSEASCCAAIRTTTGRGRTGSRRSATRLGVGPARAVAAVEAGRADYVVLHPADLTPYVPAKVGRRLTRRYGPRQRGGTSGPPAALYAALSQRLLVRVQHPPRPVHGSAAAPGRELRHGSPGTRRAHGRRRERTTDGPVHPTRPARIRRRRDLPAGRPGSRVGPPARWAARRVQAVLYTCNLPGCTRHGQILKSNLRAIGIDLTVRRVRPRRDVRAHRGPERALRHRAIRTGSSTTPTRSATSTRSSHATGSGPAYSRIPASSNA